jgi:hypothetical protein
VEFGRPLSALRIGKFRKSRGSAVGGRLIDRLYGLERILPEPRFHILTIVRYVQEARPGDRAIRLERLVL